MASGPITSWQIDGETMETGQTLISWAPKQNFLVCFLAVKMVTAVMKFKDACSFEEKV